MRQVPNSPAQASAQMGFTAIELMLAVAVVAILAAIAVPAFRTYVNRANTAAAIADITKIQARIEAYRGATNDTLPPDLATIGLGTLTDPWGQPYAYLPFTGLKGKGAMRKDKNLVPINSDYDLYSIGPDGQSVPPLTAKPSQDDIVRASDGAFVGVAVDY